MSWWGLGGARIASSRGHNVVLCPENGGCYLDRFPSTEPWELGNLSLSVPKASYDLDISMKELSEEKRKLVLGAQCCLWGERLHSGREMEMMVFPRAYILAENLWLGEERKDWEKMKERKDVLGLISWRKDILCNPGKWE